MTTWKEISPFTGADIDEDAPANAVGGGSVAGLGVGPMGEPGVHPRKKKKRETLIDGRTKAYRQHRERLEKARLKRQESQKTRGKFVENIVSGMSEMSYGAGSMGAIRPQADMANIQSAKSPLQKLRDFDKSRTAAGKAGIFTDKGSKQFYRMKKPGTMTVMNVPERELKKYQKMGYEIIE
tara:strand:+ start:369 stop:911 length:543 start_codon:yes stop_codon:yes gene_type:complete